MNFVDRFRKVKHKYQFYEVNHQLAFALSDNDTLIITGMQLFRLRSTHKNYNYKLEKIRTMIVNNEIKTVADILNATNPRVGWGIEMISLNINWILDE